MSDISEDSGFSSQELSNSESSEEDEEEEKKEEKKEASPRKVSTTMRRYDEVP